MKALSQSEYGELRNLYESIYTPKVDLTEELLDEIFDELVDEYIEEGYSEEDAIEIVDEAVDLYIDEVLCEVSDSYYDSAVRASKKAAQGIDKAARQKRRAGQVRYAKRKAGEAFKRGKELAGAAKAAASLAKDFAGDELRRAGRKAVHAVTSAPDKAKASVDRKKKGIKGFIKRQAQKVVNRMSEELEAIGEDSGRKALRQEEFDTFDVVLEFLQVEGYAETLGEAEWMMTNIIDEEAIDIILGEELTGERLKRAEDKIKSLGRRKSTADKRTSLFKVAYGKEGTGLPGSDGQSGGRKGPVKRGGGGTKGYGKVSGSGRDDMDRGYGNKAERRAAALKKEAFEAWIDEAMSSYDRNRKRAAQRAAARNAARDAGKTGAVPGVGYVTPRRERETYVDSAGITRHKSGAKMPKD